MHGAVDLNLINFSMVYLLLIVILAIMKKSKIEKTKLLIWASFRMSVQLVLAGIILTYIFRSTNKIYQAIFVIAYIIAMIVFAIVRVLSQNKDMNKKFKIAVSASIAVSGVLILLFFILIVTKQSFFNPQYTIPIAGMIIANSMTGLTIGLKTFNQTIKAENNKIEALLNLGVTPKDILLPFANNALETALLPTLNSMLGMGIIALPGMMTGQILSGTLPNTAIKYQIAIMIAICASVCLTVFCALNFGYKTLYNNKNQINLN